MSIALARAIEIAEHNGWVRDGIEGPELIVFDALTKDRLTGIRLTVETTRRSGFRAEAKDGCGKSCITYRPDRLDAVTDALDGYLHIVNNGI